MLKRLSLCSFILLAFSAQTQDFANSYSGELVVNESTSLPLQLNLDEQAATLDSPAQGAFGIPVEEVDITNTKLTFRSSVIQASFDGKRQENGCYQGQFKQGMSLALTLCPVDESQQKTPTQELAELPVDAAVVEFTDGQWNVERLTFNVDDNKQYEIGSVTKTMVAWLLAKALQDGVVSEQTPLKKYWPDANPHVGDIKLVDLATHHSGLPRLPKNLAPKNMEDPYVDYGLAKLTEAVKSSSVSLPAQYEYSNFGYGLLAETLAKAYDEPFDSLIQEKLFNPLGMSETYIALEPIDNPQLIAGTRIDGEQVPHWHFDALAGAGAVISTVDDMANYLKALMQPDNDHLPLVNTLFEDRKSLGNKSAQALAWIKEQRGDKTLIWHNGQTAGFASFIGFSADGKRGIVILSSRARSVTEIGKKLLTNNP